MSVRTIGRAQNADLSARGILVLDQRRDQPYQRFVLGAAGTCTKKLIKVDVSGPAARRRVGLMAHEDVARLVVGGEKPAVAVRARVDQAKCNWHGYSPR